MKRTFVVVLAVFAITLLVITVKTHYRQASNVSRQNVDKILKEMKKSSVQYADCNNTKLYKSEHFKLSFVCPENFTVYECANDVDLLSKPELKQKMDLYRAYGQDFCYGQGAVQIFVSNNSLYDSNPKTDPDFSVTEKQEYIDGNIVTHQVLEYEGANIPSHSEFITFRHGASFYRIRVLGTDLRGAFNQVVETLKFTDD